MHQVNSTKLCNISMISQMYVHRLLNPSMNRLIGKFCNGIFSSGQLYGANFIYWLYKNVIGKKPATWRKEALCVGTDSQCVLNLDFGL